MQQKRPRVSFANQLAPHSSISSSSTSPPSRLLSLSLPSRRRRGPLDASKLSLLAAALRSPPAPLTSLSSPRFHPPSLSSPSSPPPSLCNPRTSEKVKPFGPSRRGIAGSGVGEAGRGGFGTPPTPDGGRAGAGRSGSSSSLGGTDVCSGRYAALAADSKRRFVSEADLLCIRHHKIISEYLLIELEYNLAPRVPCQRCADDGFQPVALMMMGVDEVYF